MVLAAVTVTDKHIHARRSSRSPSSTARRPTPPARSRAASSSAKAVRATRRSSPRRIIDRSIRPLFPEGFKNEVQVFVYVISADQENDADVLALVAASFALNASRIPFTGPIAARARRPRRGQVGPQPDLPAARVLRHGPHRQPARTDSIMMVEGGALEMSEEDDVVEALEVAQQGIKELIAHAGGAARQGAAPPRWTWTKAGAAAGARRRRSNARGEGRDRRRRSTRRTSTRASQAVERVKKRRSPTQLAPSSPTTPRTSATALDDIEYDELRAQVLDTGERVDGRKLERGPPDHDRDRPAAARARLGALHARPDAGARRRDARHRQRRAADRHRSTCRARRPSRSCCTTTSRRSRPAKCGRCAARSRREIGHGNLAERALQALLPRVRGVPVHDPHRVATSSSRTARRRWRRSAAARSRCSTPACRCKAAVRRRRDGADQGRQEVRDPHRHPRHRGPPRRHGLQGRRHEGRASRRSRWTSRSRASTSRS